MPSFQTFWKITRRRLSWVWQRTNMWIASSRTISDETELSNHNLIVASFYCFLTRSGKTLTGQRNRSQFHVELYFELLASSFRQARDGIVGELCVCCTFDSLFLVVSLDNLRLIIKRPSDPNLCKNSKVTCVLRQVEKVCIRALIACTLIKSRIRATT